MDAIFADSKGLADLTSASSGSIDDDSQAGYLENMMDGQGRFAASGDKTLAYFDSASGFTFLQEMQKLFSNAVPERPLSLPSSSQHQAIIRLFDTPLPDKEVLASGIPINRLLPSRKTASRLLHIVCEQTHPLLHFLMSVAVVSNLMASAFTS